MVFCGQKMNNDEIVRLWDEGVLSEEVMEEWKTEHMRTPCAQ